MSFACVRTEGGLIPADILEQIAASEAPGQQPSDFGLPRAARLTDEIAAAWADARAYWDAFQRGLRRLPEDDPATTVTREQWVLPRKPSVRLSFDLTLAHDDQRCGGLFSQAFGRGRPATDFIRTAR